MGHCTWNALLLLSWACWYVIAPQHRLHPNVTTHWKTHTVNFTKCMSAYRSRFRQFRMAGPCKKLKEIFIDYQRIVICRNYLCLISDIVVWRHQRTQQGVKLFLFIRHDCQLQCGKFTRWPHDLFSENCFARACHPLKYN